MKIETDIIVAGTGPAGLTAALALAQAGFSVALAGPPVAGGDRRTTALMKPSLDFLERLGLLEAIRPQAAPLRAMRIADATARLLRSPTVTFRAAEIGEEMFGMNIPNAHLNAVLDNAVKDWAVKDNAAIRPLGGLVRQWTPAEDAVEAELENGDVVVAKLAAAADGRRSQARQAAGISVKTWQAGQSALVLNFSHTRPHDDISTEFHTEDGPFTQVPLPGMRSSLVWVTRRRRADEMAAVSDEALAALIEARMQSMLGRVTVEPGRQVFPLASALPARFADRRIALVGEAAHVFPPIGAQGLNLGIRDAEDLARVAAKHAADPGAKAALSAYDRARRPDILARASAVDMLNRSLLSDMLPAQAARAAGLSLLRTAPPLRAFFMREGLRTGGGLAGLLPWR
ncbi:MAG: UbiH/UbiF family hydroxylase [Aquamicrobium sp.]|uniref:UbiH/UbiF family hydroxylase n=1 Tax=Aquamicrobium sp. TaxID=1872579 RepID=UPI00349E7783|nr:UbiH/UbiF family hydroxylase [Aquamicrobium sp.]